MSHAATLTPEVLTTLIALVRQHTGIAMTPRKSVLLERRLQPRLQALSLHSYQAYLDRVASDRDEVARMLATLTPRQRSIVVLRYFDDYTEAQTAECLGISVGAVKSACSRALAGMRARYAPMREGDLS